MPYSDPNIRLLYHRLYNSRHPRKREATNSICRACGRKFHALVESKGIFCSKRCSIRFLTRPGINHPRAKWIKLTEKQARKLFIKYTKTSLNSQEFAKSVGGEWSRIRLVFLKYFPAEFEDVIESKHRRNSLGYRIGRNFEYIVREYYEKMGYSVFESPRSKGPADLVAIKKNEIILIQCRNRKRYARMRPYEIYNLKQMAKRLDTKAVLATNGILGQQIKIARIR